MTGLTFYDICWFFIVYSVAGWITEVVFQAVVKGKVVNRGFLNGPVCPVYGFGMIAVITVYTAVGSDNSGVIFVEGVVLTTLIELVAGFILDNRMNITNNDIKRMLTMRYYPNGMPIGTVWNGDYDMEVKMIGDAQIVHR